MWVKVGSLGLIFMSLFGETLEIDNPRVITPKWEEKVFGIKYYEPTTLVNSVHEMVHGIPDEYFDDQFFKRLESHLKNTSIKEGIYEEFWKNGQVKVRLPHKNGRAHGHLHGWYENGNHAFKGHFDNGVKQGVHITFYPSENRFSEAYSHILRFNMDGKLDGELSKDHLSGKLWIACEYKNGTANGPLEGWDKNCKYYLSSMYKNGYLQKGPPLPAGKRDDLKKIIDEEYVDEITNQFIKIAKKEYGAYCVSTGASMPEDVQSISVHLHIKKKATVDEAREIFVSLTERFKDLINSHEKIRPYLREYPLPFEKADVCLGFCDKKGKKYEEGSPSFIMLNKHNEICFNAIKPNSYDFYYIHKEPYEEALKKVQEKKAAKK